MAALIDLAPLGEFVLVCAFLLLLYAWLETGGKVIAWLAANFPNPSIGIAYLGSVRPFDPIVSALTGFDNYVQRVFYFYVQAAKSSWAAWVHQVAAVVSDVTETVDLLANETGNALHYVRRWLIPSLAAASTAGLWTAIRRLDAARKATERVIERPIEKVYRDVTERVTRVEKVTKYVLAAGAGAITAELPRVWRGVDDAKTDADKALRTAKDALNKFSVAGIIGLIGATIFTRFGLGWLRCSGVGRVGRSLCGLGGLIEELFAAALVGLTFGNVCEILTLAIGYIDDAQPLFAFMLDATEELLGCQKVARPPALTFTSYAGPSAQAYAAVG